MGTVGNRAVLKLDRKMQGNCRVRGNRVHVITTLLLFNERRFTLAATSGR